MVFESPTIVIAAFNRPLSLKRILSSICNAYYDDRVRLVISIDKGNNEDVLYIANSFDWKYGEKVILLQDENLGLRKHILKCGDLTNLYGSIILLEDDLFVSPYFYIYASKCLSFYSDNNNIAGVSLYAHALNVHTKLPFQPIKTNFSNYFMQLPSSWGQAWSSYQWENFKKWFLSSEYNEDYNKGIIPRNIANWPVTSWLKIFTKYMIEQNKYFVYPYTSLTTNFADSGTHFQRKFSYVQVVLQNHSIAYNFEKFDQAMVIYDAFFELSQSSFLKHAPSLEQYDFEVDLYGYKELKKSNKPYFLSTQRCQNYDKSFGIDFKPIEINVFQNNPGKEIFLVKASNFKPKSNFLLRPMLFEYFYRMPLIGELFQLFILKIRQNINDKLS